MRLAAIALALYASTATATSVAAPPPTWADTSTLDQLADDLATIARLLPAKGSIECAAYARVAPIVQTLPARVRDLPAARRRLVASSLDTWLVIHRPPLEARVTDVVTRLRRDKACPAILDDDAAYVTGRAVVALGSPEPFGPPLAWKADLAPSACAGELEESIATWATFAAFAGASDPITTLDADLHDVDVMRQIDRIASQPCRGTFGGKPVVRGANLTDL